MSDQNAPIPPQFEGVEALMWAWGQEDACFHFLHLILRACKTRNLDLKRQSFDLFNWHHEKCGSCWQNVLMTADNSTDPLRKHVYFDLYHSSQFELMKEQGGDVVVTQEAEGQRISIKYPAHMDEPWVGGEVYVPSNPTQEALIILNARDEALFKDPCSLLQRLDEVSAFEVQNFDRPSGRGIQWWTIVGDRPSRLLVHWQGETRTVAEDWTLVSRYKRLVAKHDREARLEGDKALTGKAALTLRQLALKYDGRSWFAGYAEKTLEYRRKDARRHNTKDAFGKSEVAELDHPLVDGTEGSRRVLKGVHEEATKRWQPQKDKLLDGLDLWMRRKRLEKGLTK